jgi:hypothetical protein
MASATAVRRLWLPDNPQLRRELFNKRSVGVHDINRSRAVFGEVHHLFKELRQDSARFFLVSAYVLATFDYILSRVKHRLQNKSTNFKKPISPEERLYVTLR